MNAFAQSMISKLILYNLFASLENADLNEVE